MDRINKITDNIYKFVDKKYIVKKIFPDSNYIKQITEFYEKFTPNKDICDRVGTKNAHFLII